MRLRSIVPVILLLPAAALAADAPPPIYGFYNPQTRIFAPARPLPAAGAAAVVRSGTLKIKVTATLDPVPPAAQPVTAYVSASVQDAGYDSRVSDSGPMQRSGATATATFAIDYIFTAQAASEMVTVSVQLATQAPPYPSTILTQQIKLPADGATTTVTFPQTL